MQRKRRSVKKSSQNNRKSQIVKWLWIIAIAPFAMLALMLSLTALGVFGRMPSFEELENPKSNLATEVYADDGKVLGSFFVQNRSYVQYADLFPQDSTALLNISGHTVPPLAAALIATEDARYYTHSGIDLVSLARVGVKTIALQHSSQGGGSTITQQLAKNLFPRGERGENKIVRTAKLVISKFKEWITALKLEYNYTKEEIIAMYLNTVEYGSNSYGIKSAAATFFGKSPAELNLQEAAVLVGVVNAPTRYSPIRNPENALRRRNTVLQRIEAAGGISKAQYDSLSALPITLNYRPISHNYGRATYFREMLRLTMNAQRPKRRNYYTSWDYEQACKEYDENPLIGWCHKNRKADGSSYDIYRDGLKIYTTINATMQEYAETALQKQLETVIQPTMDRQVRETGKLFNNLEEEEIEAILKRAMRNSDRYRNMKQAGVNDKDIYASFSKKCSMKVFTFKGERDTILTPRDSILHHKRIMRASFVAMEPQSGHIKAYVGGPSFQYFKYDMAKQGKRQIGSTVKPFIYTFAIDHLGLTPCTMVPNLPVTIETAVGAAWSPKESGNVEYDGVLHPLRWGLAHSRNNYSAWIMKQAKQPEAVADFIHNMGILSFIDPVYALCVGSFESNVFEMVSAYSTFANEGVYISPLFVTHIEDRQGNLISTFSTSSQDAISKESAYTMLTMLQNVITHGTGRRMIWAYDMGGVDIAGKTGTTNENRDAWFMGITPKLVAGSWVGAEDQSINLGRKGEGSVMALPIVGDFLRRVHNDPNININKSDRFVRPASWKAVECEDAETPDAVEAIKQDEFFN
ncbi:MAG: transglycosylase domain-containing protein [Alistipes sp.]|nr:transglycosylase domain-containing protein [Alistipes sp.]